MKPMRKAVVLVAVCVAAASTGVRTQSARPLALDDYLQIKTVSSPAVSPDGRYAAYVVREVDVPGDKRNASLWRVPVATPAAGAAERLTQAGSVSSPSYSPDGKYLAFMSDRSDKNQVWVLPVSGGEAFRITDVKQGISSFEWSPDSTRMALVIQDPDPLEGVEKTTEAEKAPRPIVITRLQHKQDGEGYLDTRKSHLYIAELKEALASTGSKSAEVKPLTWGIYDEGHPQWSPDGSLIAFSTNRTEHPDANDNTDLFTIQVDGGRITQLTKDPGADDDPVWSPDGSKVAYTKAVGSVRQVMVAAADASSAPVAITASTTWQASSPAWSPDGSRIVYTGAWVEAPSDTVRIIHRAVLTVAAAGGGAPTTVVTSDDTDLLDPVYTRNGTSITYVAGNDVYSAPVTGVPAGQLGAQLIGGLPWYQHIVHPQWSADGKTLVFQVAESETFTSDVFAWYGTGDPVNLTGASATWPPPDGTTAPYEAGPTWLADGRLIFVQDGNVYVMAAQRGAERSLLADLPYSVRNVDAGGA